MFGQDAAYANSKDLAKRTLSDNVLKDRIYEIVLNARSDGYQRGLPIMVYKFSDKKIGSGANVTEVLALKLFKTVIKDFKRRKGYESF